MCIRDSFNLFRISFGSFRIFLCILFLALKFILHGIRTISLLFIFSFIFRILFKPILCFLLGLRVIITPVFPSRLLILWFLLFGFWCFLLRVVM